MKPSHLCFASALALAACGRSELRLAPGAGASSSGSSSSSSGAGGSSSSSTSSSSSSSSASSSSGQSCSLFLAGSPIGTPSDGQYAQIEPALALAQNGDAVALFGRQMTEGPGVIPPPDVADVAPIPWNSWPSELDGVVTASTLGGSQFEVATSVTSAGVAVFYNPLDAPPNGNLYLSQSVPPGVENPQPGAAIVQTFIPSTTAFLASGHDRYVAGSTWESGSFQMQIAFVSPGPDVTDNFMVSGCGLTPPVGDAVAVSDGFLVALSSSRDFNHCQDDGPLGPTNRIQVGHWIVSDPKNMAPGMQDGGGGSPYGAIRLLPRGDGAWLLTQGVAPGGAGAIMARRLDPAGMAVGSIVFAAASGFTNGTFAAASLAGDGFAIAFREATTEAPTLTVKVFDATGAPGASVSVNTPYSPQDRVSLLANPTGDKLLLAWSASIPGAQAQFLQVARLDCAKPD